MNYPDGSGLRSLVAIFKDAGTGFLSLLSVRVVLDANVILADLRWLAQKRTNPSANTALLEALKAGTVTAIAPHYLEWEIEEHLPRLAAKYEIDETALYGEWAAYRKFISFLDVPDRRHSAPTGTRDPNDLPYVDLSLIDGAPVYTKDRDLGAMGASVIDDEVLALLRCYTRASAAKLTLIGATSLGLTVLGGATIDALRAVAQTVRRQPVMAVLAVAAGLWVWGRFRNGRRSESGGPAQETSPWKPLRSGASWWLAEIGSAGEEAQRAITEVRKRVPGAAVRSMDPRGDVAA